MTTFPRWWPQSDQTIISVKHGGFWTSLQNTLDIKQSKPRQAEGIVSKEMLDRSGRHFMLKNARTHTYVRLSPEEFWIWEKFDGAKTVQQIVLDYFMEYKSFAFGAVVGLIGRLREQYMLSERPHYLYADVARAIQERTFAHKATWLARLAFTREWSIQGLDTHLDRIYKYGGWILFTLPVQIAFLLVSVLGTLLFLQISREPQYALFGEQSGAAIIKLGLLIYIPLLIHEFGHAITAKHVGCEVYKGGAMLYYGLPAAFVDTTDVWMFGKRARLAVTWAGPYTGYILSGLSALVVYVWKDLSVETATSILQIGLIGFFTSTMNILPLLKLDGYYILADWLEIPRLRERSMEFIAKHLRTKLAGRETWTREEYIFLVFGALAFLSTLYFTYSGIRYWDYKTTSSLSTLFAFDGDLVAQLTNVGTVLLAISSIAYSLYLLAMRGSWLVTWLRRIGLLASRGMSALVLVAGAATLVIVPPVLLPTLTRWFMLGAGIYAFSLAAWMAFRNYREMRGSVHAGMWGAAALGFALGAVSFLGEINADRVGVGFGLYEAGLVISALAFVFADRLLRGLSGSWRAFSIGLLALAIVAWSASVFMDEVSIKTFVSILSLGALLHWKMRPATHAAKTTSGAVLESTRQRVVQAFQNIRLVVLNELEQDYGAQTRRSVENGDYRKAKALIEPSTELDAVQVHSTRTAMTPDDYGGVLAMNLDELLTGVEKAAGRSYAVRALAYGFDSLDWEQQEVAEDHLLKYVAHAAGLSRQLKGTGNDVESLVRSAPLFMSMNDQDIARLSRQWRSKRFEPGETILRQGDLGEAFYLIRAGSVEVTQRYDPQQKQVRAVPLVGGSKDQVMILMRDRKLATLGRGDYFGEAALLTGAPCNATVQAVTPVDVLWLNRNDFDKFVRQNFDAQDEAQTTLRRLSVLRQIPLFAEFEGRELSLLDQKLERLNVYPGDTIFRYGEAGRDFYIIESGRVSVQIPFTDAQGETQLVERAALGTGEYFGELSLLMDAPRSATVLVTKPTVLLRLDARSFREILDRSGNMKQALERAGSRRVLSNERWARSLAGT